MPMPAIPFGRVGGVRAIAADFRVVALLVSLDVAARLLPHAPDFTPVAATALFAASVLRLRALSIVVPLAGMALADTVLGFYDPKVMLAVYAALVLPAVAACVSRRLRQPLMIVPVLLSSTLIFFAVTNFAVWAFSPMYAANLGGLIKCYVAALPFLQNMAVGDLFWGVVLFGGHALLQNIHLAKAKEPHPVAISA